MNRLRVWQKALIVGVLIALVASSVAVTPLLIPHSVVHAHPQQVATHTFPQHRHTVSYTSAKYYAGLHPKLTSLLPLSQKPKPQKHPTTKEAARPNPGRPASQIAQPQTTPYDPADYFTFSFYGNGSTDATLGLPITVCVTADDDGAAYGEVVYLAADSGASLAPSSVVLDTSGCGDSYLYTPVAATVGIFAAINYITPTFNAWGGYEEYGEYPLPSVGSTQVGITVPSIAIPPSSGFGNAGGDGPFSAEPVNLALGNFTYTHADFLLPIRNRSLDLTRTYNSLDTSDGPFGVGWTFPFGQSLAVTTNNSATVATVRYGDGHTEQYAQNGSTWTPAPNSLVLSTLVQNGDGSFTITHKDQSQDHYDTTGKLIGMVDRNGNTLTLTYDSSGHLTTVADASGRGLSLSYDANGHVISVSDPLGLTTQYSYDANGNLVSVTDQAGAITSYSYDANHRMLTITDPRGHVAVGNTYDTQGRVTQQANAAGSVTTISYSTGQTVVTDPLGHATTYAFDFFYHQISVTNPLGIVTDYTYDGNGELAAVTDGDTETTLYVYDASGNLLTTQDAIGVSLANPNGHTVTYVYDSQNHLTSLTDANGNVTSYTYDTHGNMLSVTDALGGVTTFTYDQYGDPLSSTSPLGGRHSTTYAYDTYGDRTSSRDGLGNVAHTTYDADGRPTSTTDPSGHTSTTTYDADGRIISATDSLSAVVSYTYDGNGNRLTLTNALGDITHYAYDAVNRLISVTNPDGTSNHYTYDAAGNLTRQTDAKGNSTTFTYDANDQMVSTTDPLGHATNYTYDGAGNVATMVDANGQTTAYGYDAANRLLQTNYADSSSVSFSYDGVGNRLSMTDSTGTTTYTFDALNRLTSAQDPAGHVISYAYDAASNRTRLTYPDGRSVSYTYDNDNHLVRATDWASRSTTYTYDAAGNITAMTLPNGVKTIYGYDAANRLISVTNTGPSGVISAFQYTRDAAGQRTAVTASGSNVEVGTTTFTYDNMGRLVAAAYPGGVSFTYKYDHAGNRTKQIKVTGSGSTSTSYTYNTADELTKAGGTTFTYDNNGNMLSRTAGTKTTTYTYNAARELASVVVGGTTVNYTYNGDGFRVGTGVTTGASTTTTAYVLTPTKLPQIAEEISGATTTDDVYGLSLIASAPFSTNTKPTYYNYDGLGSVRNVTNSSGAVLSTISYDAFGAVQQSTGSKPEFQFDGQQMDAQDGLLNLRSRYYDPTLGRFIMRDSDLGSLTQPTTMNRYVYAGNDPVNQADPAGNWFGLDDAVALIGGAIIGGGASIISQAIQGNGVNWGEVAFDAGVGAAAGEATLYTGPVGTLAVIGASGAIQGAGDYCFDKCGTPDFSWGNLAINSAIGAGTSLAFHSLDLGSKVNDFLGDKAFELGQGAESAETRDFFYRTSGFLTGGDLPGWWPGSTDQWNKFIGSFPDSVIEGIEGGLEGRAHLDDKIANWLKSLNDNANK